MNSETLLMLEEKAAKIRLLILDGVYSAGSGHPGGSLSIADIMAYLYFHKMNFNANQNDRDRFVLSKGHAAPALYAALAIKGYFPEADIVTLRKLDSYLQGHPDMKGVPGVDMSTGSLAQGFSAACGIAVSAKIFNKPYKTYVVLGDGELQEGQVWEAAMFAAHYKLGNLTAFIDWNGLQIDGKVEEVMNPTPIDEKFKAFGWDVTIIDGNNIEEIDSAVNMFSGPEKPKAIICRTIKGKGVSFMENNHKWHGVAPKKDEYETARKELEIAHKKATEVLNNG